MGSEMRQIARGFATIFAFGTVAASVCGAEFLPGTLERPTVEAYASSAIAPASSSHRQIQSTISDIMACDPPPDRHGGLVLDNVRFSTGPVRGPIRSWQANIYDPADCIPLDLKVA